MIVRAKLPIGADGRNRPSLFPFGTATGRNAHSKSLYNAHASMRSFMVFPPDTIGVYLDWRTQEVGIAAALSGDEGLMHDYQTGDVYYALAKLCGLTNDPDQKRWKRENPDVRQRMKSLQLAVNYGMGVPSLAKGLDRHPLIASTIIERHRQTYSRFWQWRADMVQTAMLERRIESVFGWPLHIATSPNRRTLYNFPCQAGGAEMLRLAAWRLCEAGITPNMLIHDGLLLEVRDREQIVRGDRDYEGRRPRRLQRPRDRRRCRPIARERRPVPRQKADGEGDVGDHDAHAGARQGNSGRIGLWARPGTCTVWFSR